MRHWYVVSISTLIDRGAEIGLTAGQLCQRITAGSESVEVLPKRQSRAGCPGHSISAELALGIALTKEVLHKLDIHCLAAFHYRRLIQ